MMTPLSKKALALYLFIITVLFSSCGANLHEETLSVALVDETYYYQLYAVDNSWELFDDTDILFTHSRGDLPDGVVISADGIITGTPTELGNFEFRVTAYAIDDNWDSWYDDDDDVTRDSEWYTLFVTEESSNANCPMPTNESLTGLYMCLGDVYIDDLYQDERFTLDIEYFVDFERANDLDINYIKFTVYFDSDYFYLEEAALTSQILRESASRTNATMSYKLTNDSIQIAVEGVDNQFHKSGRFVDLPIYAKEDLEPGEYYFSISIDNVTSADDEQTIPSLYEVDGYLTIEN